MRRERREYTDEFRKQMVDLYAGGQAKKRMN